MRPDPNFFFALYGIAVFVVPWVAVAGVGIRLLRFAARKGYWSRIRFPALSKAPSEYGERSVDELRARDPEFAALYRNLERLTRYAVVCWLGGAAVGFVVLLILDRVGVI